MDSVALRQHRSEKVCGIDCNFSHLTRFSSVNRPQESGENVINCHPFQGSPKRPKNLVAMEAESLKLRHQKISVSNWYFSCE